MKSKRDVVKVGITESVHCASDVVGRGAALEHREQPRLEALGAERDAIHAVPPSSRRASSGVTVSGFASTVSSAAARQARSKRSSAAGSVNVGVPPPTNTVSSGSASNAALQLELAEHRVHVRGVLTASPDRRHEVAVAAAMDAERHVHVEVPDVAAHFFPSRLSTARNASCGTSTAPTCFIRFLPSFCFSSSLRLRVMSPP